MTVRALDPAALATALRAAGVTARPNPDGTFAVDGDAETVGRAAAAAGVVLLELRPADSAGLEEMFLRLTQAPKEPDLEGRAA